MRLQAVVNSVNALVCYVSLMKSSVLFLGCLFVRYFNLVKYSFLLPRIFFISKLQWLKFFAGERSCGEIPGKIPAGIQEQ